MADSWLLPVTQRHSLETRVALVLGNMDELVQLAEGSLSERAVSYRRLLEDPPDSRGPYNEEWLEHVTEGYGYAVWKAEGLLPQYVRRAWFVSVLSFAESEMSLTCELCTNRAPTDLALRDLRERGLRGVCYFAKKVLRLPFPDSSQAWIDLLFYSEVRNRLVHNAGRIAAEDSNFSKRISSCESFALDPRGVIKLGHRACSAAIRVAREVMLGFLDTIPVSRKLSDGLGCFPPE